MNSKQAKGHAAIQSATNARVGRRGEVAAAKFLRSAGYRIIARNLVLRAGEIDLVCISPERTQLVVVEVKSMLTREPSGRQDRAAVRPERHVNSDKANRLRRLALHVHNGIGTDARHQGMVDHNRLGLRIDIVGVDLVSRRDVLRALRPYRVVDLRHHVSAVPL